MNKTHFLRLEAGVVRLEGLMLFAILAALLFTLSMQVISRFFMDFPLAWTEELGRVLQIWLVFIGAAVGTHRCEHFVVELFMEKVNFPGKAAVARLIDLTTVGFFAILAWVSAQTMLNGAGQILPTLGISIAWSYAAIPIGCALMVLHFLMAAVRPIDANASPKEVME